MKSNRTQNKLAKVLCYMLMLVLIESVDPLLECSPNTWCLPPSNYSLNASEYKFIVLTNNMTWFEALEVCRREGRGSELASCDSFVEFLWVFHRSKELGRYWLLNAHYYLYADVPSWSNGLPFFEPVLPYGIGVSYFKDQLAWSTIENSYIQCEVNKTSLIVGNHETRGFENVGHCVSIGGQVPFKSCTIAFTNRAICKRPLLNLKHPIKHPKFEFNPIEWVQSPAKPDVFYRILDNDYCRFKSQWYCARLRCLDHNASLIDIEDQKEFEWLKELIVNNYNTHWAILPSEYWPQGLEKVHILNYYIDLHRYLYNSRNWTWGGPQKQRLFSVNLSLDVDPIECKQELCAAIRYTINRDENFSIESTNFSIRSNRCVGESTYGVTICKKRVQIPTTSVRLQTTTSLMDQQTPNNSITTSNQQRGSPEVSSANLFLNEEDWLSNIPRKSLLLATLISTLLLAFAVIMLFVCCICLSRRRLVPSSPGDYDTAVSYRIEQQELYATVASGIGSDMYEAPAPAVANSPELNTYEMVE